MESSLIRILPACLTTPLPAGWDDSPDGYTFEVMPGVERPEVVTLALQTTEPDILLLDADFHDFGEMGAFELAKEAIAARVGLVVVVISENNTPDHLRQAMLAGVEEYLIKPLEPTSLRESLIAISAGRNLRVVQSAPEANVAEVHGMVVGVLSGKGGLGKTTIATNMAALLAKATRKPIGLVGFESGDGAVLLSVQPRLGLLDMAGSMGDDEATYTPEWLRQFGVPHRNNLMYWTWKGTGTNASGEIPEDFLPNLFEACRRTNEYTFVDFPILTEDELESIAPMLDVILIVSSTADLLALRSTKGLLDLLADELRARIRIIINRADPSDMISREMFEESLERKATIMLPNDPQLAAQAINMGSPFILTPSQNELPFQMKMLAHQMFHIPEPSQNARSKKRFSLFST